MSAPLLSIITAVHNALPMNQLYWQALQQNTKVPFELIVVDNHSTDGSETFFRDLSLHCSSEKKVIYLRSETNQSYPASQNQGRRVASAPVLCFFNNDLWIPPDWERLFLEALKENPLLVLSPSGQEMQPTQTMSNRLKRRWKNVSFSSRVWGKLTRQSEVERLWLSLRWMYGGLTPFHSPTTTRGPRSVVGINGSAVVFHQQLLERVPEIWDERFQAADWHLFLTLAALHETDPSLPLPRALLDVYFHHFGRYSARQKYEPLPNNRFLDVNDFWGVERVNRLWWGHHLPS